MVESVPDQSVPVTESLGERLERLAAVGEPLRRRLYLLVAEGGRPVSRDEAAAALGISRALAAFHLDRLQEAGLLRGESRRRQDGGRGSRGRPTKVYRLSDREIDLSLPRRQYQLAARLLSDALAEMEPSPALDAAAREHGRTLGRAVRERAGGEPSQGPLIDQAEAVLSEQGYEPHRRVLDTGTTEIYLGNCPFHAVAVRHRDLVCGMNRSLVDGLLEDAGIAGTARLDPAPDRCCVVIAAGAVEALREPVEALREPVEPAREAAGPS